MENIIVLPKNPSDSRLSIVKYQLSTHSFNPISHRGGGCKQHPLTSDADFTLILWTEVPIFVTKIQVLQVEDPYKVFLGLKYFFPDPQKSKIFWPCLKFVKK